MVTWVSSEYEVNARRELAEDIDVTIASHSVAGLPCSTRTSGNNVLVIRLRTLLSHGWERLTLDMDITQTHHRQCNTTLLLIIEITCSQHLARISATHSIDT